MMEVLPKRLHTAAGRHDVTFHKTLRPALKVVSVRDESSRFCRRENICYFSFRHVFPFANRKLIILEVYVYGRNMSITRSFAICTDYFVYL